MGMTDAQENAKGPWKGKAAAVACRDTLLPSFQHNYMLITSEEFENKQAAAFNEAFIAVRTMKKHLKQLISSSIQALFHFQRQLRGEIGCHPVWVYKEAEKEIMAEVCAFFPSPPCKFDHFQCLIRFWGTQDKKKKIRYFQSCIL